MKYVLKFTRFVHGKATALHLAALRREVLAHQRHGDRLGQEAEAWLAKSRAATAHGRNLYAVSFESIKHADLVRAAAEEEARRIGGQL